MFLVQQPPGGPDLIILEVYRSHTTKRHSRKGSGRVISSSHITLPDDTQHSQQTNIHATSGTRTHNLSRRAAADLCLRRRGHWDQQIYNEICNNDMCNVPIATWVGGYTTHCCCELAVRVPARIVANNKKYRQARSTWFKFDRTAYMVSVTRCYTHWSNMITEFILILTTMMH